MNLEENVENTTRNSLINTIDKKLMEEEIIISFTFDDLLNRTKFGKYNILLFVMMGLLGSIDGVIFTENNKKNN